jgi:putative ABC transport system substrate-binding protein
VPALSRVAMLYNPTTSPQAKFFLRAIEASAPSLGVTVVDTPVRDEAAIEPAIAGFSEPPNGGLILPTDSFIQTHQRRIAELAARYRLPSISYQTSFAADGGLLVYSNGVDQIDQFRQGASYVDRILKGTQPGDLPVQLAERYQFIINLKTAKAFGLTLAPTFLARADEVIE